MFNEGATETGLSWVRDRFCTVAAENAQTSFCLVNDYGKLKLFFGYKTQVLFSLRTHAHTSLTCAAAGATEADGPGGGHVAARERDGDVRRVEAHAVHAAHSREPRAGRVQHPSRRAHQARAASVCHTGACTASVSLHSQFSQFLQDKSRAYEAFDKMVSETFAHWPNW